MVPYRRTKIMLTLNKKEYKHTVKQKVPRKKVNKRYKRVNRMDED